MRKDKPAVSVIIPIYNVEDYLEECLDSVLGQTLRDIEVICVNDGSTDSSLSIMNRYAEQDDRIRIIDKENGGYGKAVNCGLDVATGEWVGIVEPDDIIDRRMYEDLVANAQLTELIDERDGKGPREESHTADIVKSSYWLYFDLGDGTKPYRKQPNLMNCMPKRPFAFNVMENCEVLKHHPSVWSAIYRKEFLDKYGIRMIEPKGAGWADNPWFFETMLCAETIIWVPSAYYCYRQTNPNASSNLKDYSLPFDRLRDIRAIYERFEIDDEKMILALYARSFSYVCTSILEEFGFPEKDPELQKLIAEVFESMDEELVLAPKNGISAAHKAYYQDFMGKKAAKLEAHAASEEPVVSIVMPLHDDRSVLWATIDGFKKQEFEDFEVICVDCGTKDRAASIVSEVARKDKRFRLLDGEAASVTEGYNRGMTEARGEYVYFCRPGVVWSQAVGLKKAVSAARKCPNAGIVVMGSEFGASRIVPAYKKPSDSSTSGKTSSKKAKAKTAPTPLPPFYKVDCPGNEAEIALASNTATYSKLYLRTLLTGKDLVFDDAGDEDGRVFAVRALLECEQAVLARGVKIDSGRRKRFDEKEVESEQELIEMAAARSSVVGALLDRVESEDAARAVRSVLVRVILRSLGRLGQQRSSEKYFLALQSQFFDEYHLDEAPQLSYANFDEFLHLSVSFSLPYSLYQMKSISDHQAAENTIRRQRDSARKKAASASQSRWKKMRRKISSKLKGKK